MRKTALALIAVAGVAAIVGAPAAYAGSTCSMIKSLCGPVESNKGTNRDHDPAVPASVPEPGTLALLAAGVTAIGGAAWRRRRALKKG
jgi:PEP-CTERM motif